MTRTSVDEDRARASLVHASPALSGGFTGERNSATSAELAGAAGYTPLTLRLYDWYVVGLSNRYIWRCPVKRLLALYEQHVSANHLDIGVGSGYLLDHCRFPVAAPKLTLLDLSPNSLAWTSRRIARYSPQAVQGSVLAPFPLTEKFDSIAMMYLLHCVPGPMHNKAPAFAHAARCLAENGVLFGATVLAAGPHTRFLERAYLAFLNRRRIFSNADDTRENLEAALADAFIETRIEVVGSVALFSARRPRSKV